MRNSLRRSIAILPAQLGDAHVHELRPDEEWARQMLERALGAPVSQNDDGSTESTHDLTIQYQSRPWGAVEVTQAADGEAMALWKLINPPGEVWQELALVGGWMVELDPAARAKRLRKELPDLLLELEETGQRAISGTGHRWPHNEPAAQLGINNAAQGATTLPGSIYCTIAFEAERTGGVVDPSGTGAVTWIEAYLADDVQADVRSKLRTSNAQERHAFVILPPFATAPFAATDLLMRDGAPTPEPSPRLPREITHLWLVGGWSSGDGFRYSTVDGWQRFAKV